MDGDLAPDEVPPQSIWHHARRLTEHFAAVKQRRETGQQKIEEPVEDAPMMQNQVLAEMGWTP
jgi:hypothetical protein